MRDNLIYKRWDGIVTTNRCYAIHWIKKATPRYASWHPIYVYENTDAQKEVEVWLDFILRNNNYNHGSVKISHPKENMIYGTYWDKHHNRWAYGCMPTTKEVKYLKDYRVD